MYVTLDTDETKIVLEALKWFAKQNRNEAESLRGEYPLSSVNSMLATANSAHNLCQKFIEYAQKIEDRTARNSKPSWDEYNPNDPKNW